MKVSIAKQLLFFSLFFTIISCNRFHKDSSQSAIVEGKINPLLNKNPYIYFYQFTDSLSLFLCEKTATDSCLMNPDGSFKLEIKNWPKAGFFDLGTKELIFARHYFLEPGDQIRLYFEGSEMPVKLSTYQDIGRYNKFLQIFNDSFYRDSLTKRNYFVISNYMLAPDYANYINGRRIKQIQFFNSYFEKETIDSTFRYFFEKESDFNWANDKVYFLWKKRTRQEFVPLDTSYYDFIQVINVDDPKALICPGYTRYIYLFLTELYQANLFTLPAGYPATLYKSRMAQKFYSGTGRKIAYYQLLKNESSGINAGNMDPKQIALIDTVTKIAFESTGDSAFLNYLKPLEK